jgi:acyl carrier protein
MGVTVHHPGADLAALRDLISGLAAGVLGRDGIDPDESFFALDGNSLLAIRLTDRIAQATGVRIPARMFYEGSSATELAQSVSDLLARNGGQ